MTGIADLVARLRRHEGSARMQCFCPSALANCVACDCGIAADELEQAAARWQPIATAPEDGTLVWVYAAPREGLEGFVTHCAWHPDAGWCVCEIRLVELWQPMIKPKPPGDRP